MNDIFEDLANKTFKEQPGTPANAHAKKKAKEKSAREKESKTDLVFFTVKEGKVLKVKVKKNGAYSEYIGSKKKASKEEFETNLKKWKSEGVWISEDDYKDKVSELIESLNK